MLSSSLEEHFDNDSSFESALVREEGPEKGRFTRLSVRLPECVTRNTGLYFMFESPSRDRPKIGEVENRPLSEKQVLTTKGDRGLLELTSRMVVETGLIS